MKNKFALILIFFSTVFAHATTRGDFVGMQFIINTTSKNYDGSTDGSPQVLFEALNVPEQDTIIGRGKSLLAPEKILSFVCGRKADNSYQCSIYIFRSAFGRFDFKSAYLELNGQEARLLFDQLNAQNNVFSFTDEAKLLSVYSTPDRFVIKFNSQGH